MSGLLLLSPVRAHLDLDLQIVELTQRIEADPDNPELYLKRGELHRFHQEWKAAEKDYRQARKLQPDLDVVDYFIGNLKLESGHPKAAKKLLDRFLEKHPDHAKARVSRARTMIELNQPLAAAEDYTRAIAAYDERNRPDPSFYIERARALAGAGDEYVDAALRGLDEGLQRLGRPVTLQLYAIELEVERGTYDAALTRLEQIAAQADRQETWLVRRGAILERAGRPEEARQAYSSALTAIAGLPPSRRGNRAMQRLSTQAETALERLSVSDGDSNLSRGIPDND